MKTKVHKLKTKTMAQAKAKAVTEAEKLKKAEAATLTGAKLLADQEAANRMPKETSEFNSD
jgi:hypothetical protein